MKQVFKTIIRNFTRNPVTNLINLSGLSVSMTMVIILSVYCYSELTTDNYHRNGDRVYLFKKSNEGYYTPGLLKYHTDNVSGVESTVRAAEFWEEPVFRYDDGEPLRSDLLFADVDFFKLFTYRCSEGSLDNVLNDPMTVVITNSFSRKLFGNESALGKTIKLNNSRFLNVRAVIEDPQANTCLRFSAITSMESRKIILGPGQSEEFNQWGWHNFQTFLLLEKGGNPAEIIKAIQMNLPDDQKEPYRNAILIPLEKIYFEGVKLFGTDYIRNGNRVRIMILVVVALLVLLIAIVNFINITSFQWFEAVKQTGIMKVLGVDRTTVLRNIMAESFILFLAAFFIAVNFLPIVYPFIHDLTDINFNQKLVLDPRFIAISLFAILILSVMFSIIPAIRISGSGIVDNLQKRVSTVKKNFRFKGILVTAQLTISLILIAFTFMVQKQVRFGTTHLGMNQENIIGIKLTEQLKNKKSVLKNLLESNPSEEMVSFTEYFPGKAVSSWGTQMVLKGENKKIQFDTFAADPELFNMLGLQLVKGRFYSADLPSDYRKIVVNEAFLREQGIKDPIGGLIIQGMMGEPAFMGEIIGVVKDFHYKAVNQPIVPLALRNDSSASYCLVNLKTSDFGSLYSSVQEIKRKISELSPAFPVDITFMDMAVRDMYLSELQFRRTFSLFSGCAIILCCLGILALSLAECSRRVKEIGIRKVNGAKGSGIVFMLNSEFLKWVLIAFLISIPSAYFAMKQWLSGFVYKTEISWWIFALAGLTALVIALLTVSWQSWRAATRNPVKALRYE
jgi:putative ABC transport system permease protein